TARLMTAINASEGPVLAVDLPSGLEATTGEPFAPCVRASATLTLALPKTGLLAPRAAKFVGDLWVADIGVPETAYARAGLTVGPIFSTESLVSIPRDFP
ncbi:MAG: NAD(P)H-hydrate epimerase, partial [Chloroflexia bacterium]|nr:NAD(P)H-hydrate epimerase [Chloroflexia bacterium]